MGKFNMDNINKKLGVGEGLLNEQSKGAIAIQKKTEYIPFTSISPNPRNKMSMDGIDELASQIKLSGLEQPLVVYQKEDGSYMILTGHRRYTAIRKLIERGDWDQDQLIECKVKDLDAMDIPLGKEDKEMLSILVTNQSRNKTDSDIAFEIKEWKNIISRLRENGVSYMVAGYDEYGNPIEKNIVGVRTQEIVASQMGISSAQVAKFNKVENQGSDALKNALKNDKININNASNVASMPVADQEEFIEKTLELKGDGEQITSDDVAVAKKKQVVLKDNKKNNHAVGEDIPVGLINDKVFKQDMKHIQKAIKSNSDGIQLSENQYRDYCRYIIGLKKVFNV